VREGRIRKAWSVRVKGYDDRAIAFAPTRGKACAQIFRSIDDGYLRIVDVSARRQPSSDVILPERSPMADLLNAEETHCLLHAFGGNGDPLTAGRRDYFYTRRDDPPLVSLTNHGLMKPMDGDKFGENMTYFILTAEGKHVALSLVPEYRK
jgi:hypothetical protein